MTAAPQRRRALALAAVASLALVRGAFLAAFIPPFQGPDEPAHFDYAQRLAEDLRLPVRAEACTPYSAESRAAVAAVAQPIWQRPQRPLPPLSALALPADEAARTTSGCGSAANYPVAYYATAAVGYRAASARPFFQRLFAARLASVAWSVATACFGFVIGIAWWGRTRDGFLLGVIASAQPMIAFFGAVVNNDAALFACATAAFAAIALLARDGWRRRWVALLVAATVVASLSKPTLTFALPVLWVSAALALGARSARSWLRSAAALAPAALATGAWAASTRVVAAVLPPVRSAFSYRRILLDYILNLDRFTFLWHRTYWMTWGWVDTWLGDGYYQAIAAVMVLAAAGVALGWRGLEARERVAVGIAAAATAYLVLLMYAIELALMRVHGMVFVQGRYILALFPLHATALAIGLRALARWVGAAFDGAAALAAFLLLLDGAAIARVLVRYYA